MEPVRTGDLTCPRCHTPCFRLIAPYWESPNDGLCNRCCIAAAERFDKTGWPEPPKENP